MPKTTEEVLTGLLSTSYKLDEGRLSALKEADGSWKDEAIDFFAQEDQKRVTALRGDTEKLKGDSYSRGKREAMEALEKSLRDEFGIKDIQAQGVDLVKHIVSAKAKALETIPDERVKVHPLYLQLEEQARTLPVQFEEKLKQREGELKAEFETRVLMRQAADNAKTIFRSMNPILPKDPRVAEAQMTLLDNWLGQHKLEFVKDSNGNVTEIIPMKADGSGRLEDAHGHPVKYEEFVKNGAARFFEFAVGEQKGGAPDPNGMGRGNGGGGNGTGEYDPKSEADYARMHGEIMRAFSGADQLHERRKMLDKLKETAVRNGVVAA